MAEVKLSKGAVAQVDDEDLERVNRYSWHFDGRYGSATIWNKELKKYEKKYLHRYVMDAPKYKEIDHINRDKLDNRKANLRYCTRAENISNKERINKSGKRGVFKEKNSSRYLAYITIRGRLIRLGTWDTKEEASLVRKAVEGIFYPHNKFD